MSMNFLPSVLYGFILGVVYILNALGDWLSMKTMLIKPLHADQSNAKVANPFLLSREKSSIIVLENIHGRFVGGPKEK